ncbi:MAG: nucleoside triphosphate pyrophosphohydrolase [Planctomycetota bacterium]
MSDRLAALKSLVDVIDRLRAPQGGCPWDLKQTVASMAPMILEEAYEAIDAIQSARAAKIREELGDLLMNVVLTAKIAEQDGTFDLGDVASGIAEKLVRRHPHVFGEQQVSGVDQVLQNWEKIKKAERTQEQEDDSAVAGVPRALPALLRAYRIGEKAGRVGFEWPDLRGAERKVDEERAELNAAIESGVREAIERELGDLLFAMVNVARHLKVDAELALRRATDTFERRFRYVESHLGKSLEAATLEEMEQLWQEAKRHGL